MQEKNEAIAQFNGKIKLLEDLKEKLGRDALLKKEPSKQCKIGYLYLVVPIVEQPRVNPEVGSGLVKHIVELKVVCPDEDKLKEVRVCFIPLDEETC
jgi:hypothetical protein